MGIHPTGSARGAPLAASEARFTAPARMAAWGYENLPVICAFVGFFLVWEASVHFLKIAPFILPPPTTIFARLIQDWSLLLVHLLTTLNEVVLGFGLSVVVSLALATLVVANKTAEKLIMPFIVALKTIPKIALAPILIIWFGYGLLPKVAIVFLISFFPIVISAIIGLRSTEKEMIYLARSMSASGAQIFLKIRFPKAMPSIFGGLRIGIVQAVIGAIVAEYLASESGLGYLQLLAQSRMDTPLLFATVVVLSLMGIILFNLVVLAERLCMPWEKNTGDLER